MAVTVKLSTMLRKETGVKEYESSAHTVGAVMEELVDRHGTGVNRHLEGCIVTVNGKNAEMLKGMKTKLRSGDVVSIIPRLAGG